MEDDKIEILNNSAVLLLAALSYCYFFVTKIPQGFLRVSFVLPMFYIFYVISWNFSSAFIRGVSAFFITWITSFKILLFCFNKGPLLSCKNFVDFIVISIFPAKLRDGNRPQIDPLYSRSIFILAEIVVLAMLLKYMWINIEEGNYPKSSILVLYIAVLFVGSYVIVKYQNSLIQALTRYELVELFKQPYLATSFADFWGRRWNRLSSNMLRLAIYNPTREMLTDYFGSKIAKVAAIISTFLVSAIMHELMFYYITCGIKPTLEVTKFFM